MSTNDTTCDPISYTADLMLDAPFSPELADRLLASHGTLEASLLEWARLAVVENVTRDTGHVTRGSVTS